MRSIKIRVIRLSTKNRVYAYTIFDLKCRLRLHAMRIYVPSKRVRLKLRNVQVRNTLHRF